jgi:predicted dehydrogenase
MSEPSGNVTRRDFIKTSAGTAVSLAALGAGAGRVFAGGSDRLRVGVIGCGGRGTGAAVDCLASSDGIRVVALADPYRDRMEGTVRRIREWCAETSKPVEDHLAVTPEGMYDGFDGYRKLLARDDVDLVVMGAPPVFRPRHFEEAVRAGKHVFMEKPVAVDPPGVRKVIAAGELARQSGLGVVAGTQRRHQRSYLQCLHAIREGAIGRIVSGRVWWCGGRLWYKERQPEWSDADYLVHNWVSFNEMSGDHIVEQHVHNLDVAAWFIGRPPKLALGFGGRARRRTGNQFDFFSVDYDYGDDVIVHSMCRQVNGCYQRVSEHFVGTDGSAWGGGKIEGKSVAVPPLEEMHDNPYVQEHRDLVRSIREGKPLNEARQVAESTLAAIMGRISAYTGQVVRWSDLTEQEDSPWYGLTLSPTPEDFERGEAKAPEDDVFPVPGQE